MQISVYASAGYVQTNDVRDKLAVVVDTLRATTSIVTALSNGAVDVAPMATIEDAVGVRRSNASIVLGGERKAIKIPEFDVGNSPFEYSKERVGGRHIAITTTNGSSAILSASKAARIIVGALINASAVAQKLLEWERDCVIICAGTEGRFSMDDIVTAGALISRVMAGREDVELDDLGILCERLYEANKGDIAGLMEGTRHYSYLKSLGLTKDLEYCLTEDIVDFAPEFEDGIIRRV